MTAFISIAPVGAINSLLFRGRQRSLGGVQTATAALPSHREAPCNFPALFPVLAPDISQARSRHTPAAVTALTARYPPDVPLSGPSGEEEHVAGSCDGCCWSRSSRHHSTAEELPVPRGGGFQAAVGVGQVLDGYANIAFLQESFPPLHVYLLPLGSNWGRTR